ncbi:MAG: hypothetical protein AAF958_08660 [Planctomycetota bacterium]
MPVLEANPETPQRQSVAPTENDVLLALVLVPSLHQWLIAGRVNRPSFLQRTKSALARFFLRPELTAKPA